MNAARPFRGATEDRYRDRRLAALRRAEEIALQAFAPVPLRLDVITPTALRAFQEQWEANPRRSYPWPWPKMVDDTKRNEPDRFELSVWSGETLCGLAIGWTREAFCRVDYLEGSPDPDHPLKGSVTAIAAGAATAYATFLGKDEIRLTNPLPAVVPRHEDLGFTLVSPKGGAPYCLWKKVT